MALDRFQRAVSSLLVQWDSWDWRWYWISDFWISAGFGKRCIRPAELIAYRRTTLVKRVEILMILISGIGNDNAPVEPGPCFFKTVCSLRFIYVRRKIEFSVMERTILFIRKCVKLIGGISLSHTHTHTHTHTWLYVFVFSLPCICL
jgi:hypothetical protein